MPDVYIDETCELVESPPNGRGFRADLDAPPGKVNLGAGHRPLPGFTNLDGATGDTIYPLTVPDNSQEEIRASHVLEHFSHTQVTEILKHWVQKLRPGGCLKIAVPDFEWIAKQYLDGQPIPVQSYVMGGHQDNRDHHGCIFDRESLTEAMLEAGLERIGSWRTEVSDCASLPVSLNLQGSRPTSPEQQVRGVYAILSAPRFGPTMHAHCATAALGQLRIPYKMGTGAYWHQVLSELAEQAIASSDCRYLLTLDYDTVFSRHEVLELYRLMEAAPAVDALCPVQQKRNSDYPLFGAVDRNGNPRSTITDVELDRNLLPITTGHFGLTLIRASSLRKLPRPWMVPAPGPDGRWQNGRTDADIAFWKHWRQSGLSLYLAPRVPIGHLQEAVIWPGEDLKPVYQLPGDYEQHGIPAGVRR